MEVNETPHLYYSLSFWYLESSELGVLRLPSSVRPLLRSVAFS